MRVTFFFPSHENLLFRANGSPFPLKLCCQGVEREGPAGEKSYFGRSRGTELYGKFRVDSCTDTPHLAQREKQPPTPGKQRGEIPNSFPKDGSRDGEGCAPRSLPWPSRVGMRGAPRRGYRAAPRTHFRRWVVPKEYGVCLHTHFSSFFFFCFALQLGL